MTLQKFDDGVFVDATKIDKIKSLDGVIFDCDGVLIDVSHSYDLAIKKTVDLVIREIANLNESNVINSQIMEGFKATGGFNDEVDLTYALILAIVAARKAKRQFSEFIIDVIKNSDQTGIISVEKFLDTIRIDLSEIKSKLAYPDTRENSVLSSIFDEIFYGSKLYYDLYKKIPKYFSGKGLIDNDKVLLKKELIGKIREKFGQKLAIVSGRGFQATEYSLRDLLKEFDLKNSRFLEDEPRELAKPNPQSLIMSIRGLGTSCTLFVGDSMEDFIMARKSDEAGNKTVFCGIYGTSKDPETKRKLFGEKNADIILETIDLIPKALNLVRP